ncbi:synaptotagmin-6-like [Pocillopora damicornis]|uniref:synaptotagmin-6-like n=1 Tax=Pocillopora damicornis TaxID=46731 RepID=UPI000F55908E|nr:synaptotagmin-6-like [Pocillopora damicornis]
MTEADESEKIRQIVDYYVNDEGSNGQDTVSGERVKIRIAIGFAATCAVLLLAIFIILLYKVLWFRSKTGTKTDVARKPSSNGVPVRRAPSPDDQDFKKGRRQRRHQPLMRSDSSVSEIDLDSWLHKNNNRMSANESDSSEESLKLGKLEFNINYDTNKECLRVLVLAAYGLPTIHSTSYVELYLLPDRVEKHQTKVHYSNSNPFFNEEFVFDIAFSELAERTLQCCVFSYDGFSRHQSLGEVFYSFGENDHLSEHGGVALCKEIMRDASLLKEDSPSRAGEVLVSLCYLPTTNRLTFVVLKARLSKTSFPNDLPHPFVKVSLMLSGRQLKKTKTSVAKNTLAPVYNEAFVFDVPIDRLSDVSLLVRMLDTNTEDGRRPQTKTIGKAIVGPDAQTSIGLHHWNCMMTTPRKPIAQWHPLVKT